MNSRATWQFGLLSAANLWVTFALVVACKVTAFHWAELLPGQDLPLLSVLALRLAPWIAIALLVIGLVGAFLAVQDQIDRHTLSTLLAMTAVSEAIFFGLYAWALILPIRNITYTIGAPVAQ